MARARVSRGEPSTAGARTLVGRNTENERKRRAGRPETENIGSAKPGMPGPSAGLSSFGFVRLFKTGNSRVRPQVCLPLRLSRIYKNRNLGIHPLVYQPLGSSRLFKTGNSRVRPLVCYLHLASSRLVTSGNLKVHPFSCPAFAAIKNLKRQIQPDDTFLSSVEWFSRSTGSVYAFNYTKDCVAGLFACRVNEHVTSDIFACLFEKERFFVDLEDSCLFLT